MKWNFKNSYLELPAEFFRRQSAATAPNPRAIVVNDGLIEELGLGKYEDADLSVLAGNSLAEGSEPFAQAYAGHQYGHFTMLGDGRALVLGEHVTPDERRFDIQLKGSGRTPFSRRGDGKAALGPMLREFLLSEAMHALGVPTTRSLAVIATGEPVYREEVLPGAILTRIASSHIRVGTFEFAAAREGVSKLEALAQYTLRRHYPEIAEAPDPYVELLRAVSKRQARLVAQWLSYGFIHGVMNTDNMAVSGETIDYGPCAFMNGFDPMAVFSSIDERGRYAYGNQARIALWNLERFAEALLRIIDASEEIAKEKATAALQDFATEFNEAWLQAMGRKLGLADAQVADMPLVTRFLELMQKQRADFTNTFWRLSYPESEWPTVGLFATEDFQVWSSEWRKRLEQVGLPAATACMRASNAAIIPRNHRVEEALAAAHRGDLAPFRRLWEAVSRPFDLKESNTDLQTPPTAEQETGYQTFCGT